MTEDKIVGWHHWLDGHEFEPALGIGDGQRSLPCCSPWGCKESDTPERLKAGPHVRGVVSTTCHIELILNSPENWDDLDIKYLVSSKGKINLSYLCHRR